MKTTRIRILTASAILTLGLCTVLSHPSKAALPAGADLSTINQFIELMGGYLDISEQWMKLVEDDDFVIYLVAEGITEVYEAKGDPAGAVPELEKLADQFKGRPRVATAIRFKLRDLYKDSGQLDKALDELHAIQASKLP